MQAGDVEVHDARGGGRYWYRPDVALADVDLVAQGTSLEQLFGAAWEAANRVLMAAPERIEPRCERSARLQADTLELLLFDWLGELIYWKDAHGLVGMVRQLRVQAAASSCSLEATLAGEPLDPVRHEPLVDVKAVTLYRLRVQPVMGGWEAEVVLDI